MTRISGRCRDRRPPPPGRFVEAGGLRWHVEEAGDGDPAILLFHGYLGSTAVWHRSMPRLAARCRVLAADLPGAGYSDRPGDAPYDLEWLSSLVPGLMETLGLGPCLLGGHSLGGAVALRVAAAHPSLCRGLVLVAPLAYEQIPPPGLRFAQRHPGIAGRFFASPLGRLVIPRLVRRAAFATPEAKAAVNVRRLLGHLDAPGGWVAATRMGLAAVGSAPTQDVLRRISCPAVVFWGEEDVVHPCATAHRVAADLGGPTRVCLLPATSHNCHEEAAETFAALTLAWAEELSQDARTDY
jgi:magnesium chelatase accessory protein